MWRWRMDARHEDRRQQGKTLKRNYVLLFVKPKWSENELIRTRIDKVEIILKKKQNMIDNNDDDV